MQQTEHYQLNQWELDDRIQMADFNSDNQKVEAALHGLAEQTAGKADASTVNDLTAQVSKKAEKTALAADVAALRAENLWVKLGEATLTKAAAELSVTVPNAELYKYFYCQYQLNGPKGASFSGVGSAVPLFDLEAANSIISIGTVEVLRSSSTGALVRVQTTTNDGSHTWGNTKSALRMDSAINGTVVFQLYTEDANFASGAHMVLYGLKK